MPDVTDLLGHAIDKSPVDFADAFDQLMRARAADAIENQRTMLSQSIYAQDDNDPEDDSVDTDDDSDEYYDDEDNSGVDLDFEDEDLDLDNIDLDDLDLDDEDATDEDA